MDDYNEFIQDLLLGIRSSIPFNKGVKLSKEGFVILPNCEESDATCCDSKITIHFSVHHDELLPTSLEDSVCGSGDTIEQAIGNAVRLWVEGTLPVLHYLHHGPAELSRVTKIAFTSKINNAPVRNYDLICGPLQNDMKRPKGKEAPEKESKIIEALQDPLASHLQEEETFCIIANVAKKGEVIHSQCLVNNERWSEGSEALHYWAERWGICNPPKVQKQFFICIPQKN